jgi:hypothetical protein
VDSLVIDYITVAFPSRILIIKNLYLTLAVFDDPDQELLDSIS